MRKIYPVLMLLLVLLVGCGKETIPERGDFSFTLPQGYSISQVTDISCTILDPEGAAVGGINLTDIRPSELKNKRSTALPRYLNETAEGCEFFSWVGDDPQNPVHYVSQYVTDAQTGEKLEFYRLLFVKNGGVYDLWLDLSAILDTSVFHAVAENP